MMAEVAFHPAARVEAVAAAVYLEAERTGEGEKFEVELGELGGAVVAGDAPTEGVDAVRDRELAARVDFVQAAQLVVVVEYEEREIIGKMAESGRTFMGMARVLRQDRHDTPSSPDDRRGIRPTVAGQSKWARIEALQQNARFLEEHEAARRAFVAGNRDVLFPHGTYLMRVRYGCACASP